MERTLASRLAVGALELALESRQPRPGLVHHSDRGTQYASQDYIALLKAHHIVPSMSRPANPYDNAACESFMKTLKQEEIYCGIYRDLADLSDHIEEFIDRYYNRQRLHSALGYRTPEEFEADHPASLQDGVAGAAKVSFFRHREIYRPDVEGSREEVDPSRSHRSDESPAGYSSASCSPAELASASPADSHSATINPVRRLKVNEW